MDSEPLAGGATTRLLLAGGLQVAYVAYIKVGCPGRRARATGPAAVAPMRPQPRAAAIIEPPPSRWLWTGLRGSECEHGMIGNLRTGTLGPGRQHCRCMVNGPPRQTATAVSFQCRKI